MKIDGFAGILSTPTQPGMTFADEIAGRLRVIACLDQMPNLAASDIPDRAGFNADVWEEINAACNCKHTDAIVVIWGPPGDVVTALSEIKIRAIEATKGVPLETRQALKNGATDFERILPGPDRMYPDTDSPPVTISRQYLDRLRAELPEPAHEIEARWASKGVPEDIAYRAVVSPYAKIFDMLVCRDGIAPRFAWSALRQLRIRDRAKIESLNGDVIGLFEAHKARRISRDSLLAMLAQAGRDGAPSLPSLLEQHRPVASDEPAVKTLICEFVEETAECRFRGRDDRVNYICGRIKERLQGRIDGVALQKAVAAKV
jgi:glutamyl-tRNA(Gln) amidotransferase subunit E